MSILTGETALLFCRPELVFPDHPSRGPSFNPCSAEDNPMSHMTLEKTDVVSDLDECATPFVPYFAYAVRQSVPVLARIFTDKLQRPITMDDVSFELGRIMRLRGTHEWPWVFEESRFWQCIGMRRVWPSYKKFRDEVVDLYWSYLDVSRRKNCKPLPTVMEGLKSLRTHNRRVSFLSNGPDHMVFTKAADNGIDEYATIICALETPEPPAASKLTDEMLAYGRDRVKSFRSRKMKCRVHSFPTDYAKPDPRGLRWLMKELGTTSDTTIFIGDSLPGDGGVAQACGVPFLWAAYGCNISREYERCIEEHFIHPEHRKPHSPQTYPPMLNRWGAARWAQVLDHLAAEELPLLPTILEDSERAEPTQGLNH
jgi:phosphoglycolate phosphatase-like HAD superfamily hydrolase